MDKYLIVGLGNPGKEYANTRHQAGMIVLDKFAQENNLSFNKNVFNGLVAEYTFANKIIFLAKPQTYMNLSGDFIYSFVRYYQIPIENILVIFDDISLPFGTFKLKTNSSAGGHNGMKDIINKLNTQDIKRLKIGILDAQKLSHITIKDYVLQNFSASERQIIEKVGSDVGKIISDFIENSFIKLCSKYN